MIPTEAECPFRERFVALFEADFPRLRRTLDRISGDPDLAADLAQEAFVRLYRRGSLPDEPGAWLVTVALNLFRNGRVRGRRRGTLLTPWRARGAHADPAPAPDEAAGASEARLRVMRALARLPERERSLLLLRSEGYAYREIATVLGLHEGSVGTLLARARGAFRRAWEEETDAPR